jgi:hypothetical protein
MRASKLITLSAATLLAGGANLALAGSPQTSGSMENGSSLSHGSMKSHGIAPKGTYGRANPRELGEAATDISRDRMHAKEMTRDLPRLSTIGTSVRIDAVVPRSVREAAAPLPPEIQRMHPRMRHDRAFIYRDQVVIVNPVTSRIVGIIKAPA